MHDHSFFFFPSTAPSCLSCAAAPCSWDLSTSEDWATCWEPTVPAAARCPTRPWCLGTALTGGCSTQSTCWHTVAPKILCWWRAMWVKTEKNCSFCTCTVSFIYYFLLCTTHVWTVSSLSDECHHPVSSSLGSQNVVFTFSSCRHPVCLCFCAWERN